MYVRAERIPSQAPCTLYIFLLTELMCQREFNHIKKHVVNSIERYLFP